MARDDQEPDLLASRPDRLDHPMGADGIASQVGLDVDDGNLGGGHGAHCSAGEPAVTSLDTRGTTTLHVSCVGRFTRSAHHESRAGVEPPGPLAGWPRPAAPSRSAAARRAPLAAAMLALTFLVIAVLIWLGVTRYDRAARYFGEGRPARTTPACSSLASAVVAAVLARRAGRHPVRRFWWVVAGAFLYLSLDEVYGLHEELDRGVHKLLGWRDRRHWLTDHLDDVFVALYGVIALAWADRHFEGWCGCAGPR